MTNTYLSFFHIFGEKKTIMINWNHFFSVLMTFFHMNQSIWNFKQTKSVITIHHILPFSNFEFDLTQYLDVKILMMINNHIVNTNFKFPYRHNSICVYNYVCVCVIIDWKCLISFGNIVKKQVYISIINMCANWIINNDK